MSRFPLIFTLILFLSLQIHQTVNAQERTFEFDPNLEYDSQITSPAEFLGYELGDEYTLHSEVVRYFQQLDEESDKLTLHKYGETYEGRGLYYAVITSEENQESIDEIRNTNLRLANPDELGDEERNQMMAEQPVLVWLSYNVHGNEPSSSESAMQTAYRMVAGMDLETDQMREDAITIIDPMINPDGRDRYVFWVQIGKKSCTE
jgi:hypothetical protein